MSEVRAERRTASSPSPGPGDGDAPVDAPSPGARRARRATRWGALLTVVAMGGLGFLGYQGYEASLNVKGGATSELVTDPAAPGYVAAVDASPVHLVAITDADDALSAFVLFVPDPAGGSGSIVWTLGELIVDADGTDVALNQLYATQGIDAARAALEEQLGFGATDVTIVGPDQVEAAAAALGEVEVSNPDPVSVETKGKRTERFDAGEITLDADELGEFLTIRGAGEAPENRSTRAQALFEAMIPALVDAGNDVATAPTAPSANNADAGPDLATTLVEMGEVGPDFVVLPTERQSFRGSYLYRPDAEAIEETLAGVVRFPMSAFPGQRPRVRILNGTTDREAAGTVAPDLAAAGGEVLLVGNADSFDVATTSVVYSNESFEAVAKRIADVLGATAEQSDEVSDSADIDVVLGADHQG